MAEKNSCGPLREGSKLMSHGTLEEELSKSSTLRELEEARIRECQMEKTVRWWTACTAGWRKKWSKVRQERDAYKQQVNTTNKKLTAVLSEVQMILEDDDGSYIGLQSKLNILLQKYMSMGDCSLEFNLPEVPSINDRPPDDDEDIENVKEAEIPNEDDKSTAVLVMKINELQKNLDEQTAMCAKLTKYKDQINLLVSKGTENGVRVSQNIMNKESTGGIIEVIENALERNNIENGEGIMQICEANVNKINKENSTGNMEVTAADMKKMNTDYSECNTQGGANVAKINNDKSGTVEQDELVGGGCDCKEYYEPDDAEIMYYEKKRLKLENITLRSQGTEANVELIHNDKSDSSVEQDELVGGGRDCAEYYEPDHTEIVYYRRQGLELEDITLRSQGTEANVEIIHNDKSDSSVEQDELVGGGRVCAKYYEPDRAEIMYYRRQGLELKDITLRSQGTGANVEITHNAISDGTVQLAEASVVNREELVGLGRDCRQYYEPDHPEIMYYEKKRLELENITLRSEVRNLCSEICAAQAEMDNVTKQYKHIKGVNELTKEYKAIINRLRARGKEEDMDIE